MCRINCISFIAFFATLPQNLGALECKYILHQDTEFAVCKVDASAEDIRLFHRHPKSGETLSSFNNVQELLAESNTQLDFAMNAGMYHQDRSPVGLYVERGHILREIITTAGPGNFGMLPNGVFCVQTKRADVIESRAFLNKDIVCDYATQSGPMLVIDGDLHPRFIEGSDSVFLRNGVGTSSDGREVYFAMSTQPVNFISFATLYRDRLKVSQALYLDGKISRLFAPSLERRDYGLPMGPIIGVVGKSN
ncbi:MAG: phosphodiester glycosidase family protein [Aestuariivita sp.]|nr:phosphodiester glycosidase family protein [Aestuariivita sp.]MCY4347524.1 phosphodiester glycosidase family protein [Aestuariivita sp.]